MCGICGFIKLPRDEQENSMKLIRDMANAIAHRGPDNEGFYSDTNIELGFRRLSIIDIEGGRQPIFNEDKTIAVVFNGEIYNYKSLRSKLLDKGHILKTDCDSEVIAHLYEDEGAGFVNSLDGMFAVCLWDSKKRRLFLIRDRMGKKPLYYYYKNGRFVFSSEIKSLLKHTDVSKTINYNALPDYFALNYIPYPSTIYNDIYKLPPAHILDFDFAEIKISKYWDLTDCANNLSMVNENDIIPQMRRIFFSAVKKRLMSDVPLGVLLSGGLDSSGIVAALRELGENGIPTFSVNFRGFPQYNEESYSLEVANAFNTNHTVLNIEHDCLDSLDGVVYQMDEPIADKALIPSFLIFQQASKNVKVILSGEGADELFCGYSKYRYFKLLPSNPVLLPSVAVNFFKDCRRASKILSLLKSEPSFEKVILWDRVFMEDEAKLLFNKELIFKLDNLKYALFNSGNYSLIEKIALWDLLYYLPENLLMKVDKLSMSHGLEARTPYLDTELVKLALSLPVGLRVRGYTSKQLLRDMFKGILPDRIINRKKHGFTLPVKEWIKNDDSKLISKYFSNEELNKNGFFNIEYIKAMISAHQSGRQDHTRQIWNLLTWQVWRSVNGI